MRTILGACGAAAVVFGLAGVAVADTDVGSTPASQTINATLVLKAHDGLEQFVASTQNPWSWDYHRFLSVNEFVNRFAPSDHDLNSVKQYLASKGITVTEVYADHLIVKATGTVDAFNNAFAVDMHDHDDGHHHRWHRPHHAPQFPNALRNIVDVLVGLDQNPSFKYKPHHVDGHRLGHGIKPVALPSSGAIATGQPGNYTVGDVANLYNINPLYAKHIDGHGKTIGIATLAGFDPADAYQYWDLIGLTVKPNRITQVHVDGGGPISAVDGTGETLLDIEQSGGLAPQASIVVYDAPNTDVGFNDVFYKAASENLVDTLSVSWGEAEEWYMEALAGVDNTGELRAFHQAFLELAAQGTSVFAAAGDNGAYDINPIPGLANVLTVDHPASDPALVAAGGTTVPATLDFGVVPPLVITQEQVWGWDYLNTYFLNVIGIDIFSELFPAGGGGGVSIFFERPEYQHNVQGVRRSEAHQSLVYDAGDGSGPSDLLDLPAGFAGRNVPDVSLNADPETGYLLYSTPDGGLLNGYGGTSFVSPQLNGITILLNQNTGGRLGLINPMLYRAHGQHHQSAFVDVTAGDNWFYGGTAGYNPGSGLGVLDVANLADAIKNDRGWNWNH